jgi:hypothetical protein
MRTDPADRIEPSETGKSNEVRIGGVHYGIVFNSCCGNLSVRNQIATGPKAFQKCQGSLDVLSARHQELDRRLREPGTPEAIASTSSSSAILFSPVGSRPALRPMGLALTLKGVRFEAVDAAATPFP